MKKIILSSLIAAGFMFTGCANKSLVDNESNTVAIDTLSIVKKTIEVKDCSQGNIISEKLTPEISLKYGPLYVNPDSYSLNMQICKESALQVRINLDENIVYQGKSYTQHLSDIQKLNKCGQKTIPYTMNATNNYWLPINDVYKEYMNGVREKIDVCENDKGLIDLEINLHTMILDKK